MRLSVYAANGQRVRTLVNGPTHAGVHDVTWDGRDARGRQVSTRVYLCRLTTGTGTITRKMVLVR